MNCVFFVVTAFLAEAWMLQFVTNLYGLVVIEGRGLGLFAIQTDLNLLCIGESQGQFVTVNTQFHRVSKRRELLQRHLSSGYHTHIEEVLPKRSFTTNLEDGGRLSPIEFSQCHSLVLLFVTLCKGMQKAANNKQLLSCSSQKYL